MQLMVLKLLRILCMAKYKIFFEDNMALKRLTCKNKILVNLYEILYQMI